MVNLRDDLLKLICRQATNSCRPGCVGVPTDNIRKFPTTLELSFYIFIYLSLLESLSEGGILFPFCAVSLWHKIACVSNKLIWDLLCR